ncbi:hypothetical protein ACOZ4F_14245 [Haloarcula marismortui]|uniref:hypothetical protein n=1 Tax=Haloarcula marismortui TaxID=2238 RepID=UPI003C792F4B
MKSQISAVLLALVLVASPISMVAGPGVIGPASAQTGAPDGMVTIPDTNVVEDLPVGASSQLTKADLEGSVMASRDADSLQVIVTTPERASGYVNGSRVSGSGDRALVFRDNSSHSGRDVAVPADAVRETVGHVPNVVHGVHEDGTSWTAEVEARNGLLIFNIPHFSSNSVTFEGQVSIQETPAVDGSTTNYQVGDSSNTGEFQINVTGADSTETETVSGSALADGSTLDLRVAGTDPATDASVTFTGHEETSPGSASGTGSGTATVGGNVNPSGEAVSVTGDVSTAAASTSGTGVSPGHQTSISVGGNIQPANPTLEITGRVGAGPVNEVPDDRGYTGATGDHSGMRIDSLVDADGVRVRIASDTHDPQTAYLWDANENAIASKDISGKSSGDWVTIKEPLSANTKYFVVMTNGGQVDDLGRYDQDNSEVRVDGGYQGSTSQDGDGTARVYAFDAISLLHTPTGVTASTDDGTSASYGSFSDGETKTKAFDLSQSTSSVTIDADSGTFDYSLSWTERTASEDPSIDIDGDGNHEASWTGIYKSGETTTSKSVDGLSVGDNSVSTATTAGPSPTWDLSWTERTATMDPSVDIDSDGSAEAAYSGKLTEGQTHTESVADLAVGSTGSISTTSGSVDLSVSMTEHTVTRSPTILVNGNETGYSGRLDPGQLASLTTDTAWINDGSNTVEVRVGDGTLSSDAPTPAVDMEYTHTASEVVDTTYTADGWEESYNVSHTFAADWQNAELRIPFSQRIYQITHVEKSVNGGSWQSVSSGNWELQNGTDLVVQLKDTDGTADVVEAGDQVAIRTAGNKFQTTNGAISITDPTTPDDDGLDTGFKVDSKSTGFRLEVGGTPLGDQVHYTHTESWEAPEDRAVLSADGSQSLRLPNAQTGGSARVTTIPLEPQLDSGDVGIRVVDPDNPTLAVDPGESGSGATVQFRWHDAVPGEQYGLYSLGKERYVDKKDAGESYVQLADDDTEETLVIKQPDGGSGGSGSSGGGQIASGAWDNGGDGIDLQQIATVVAWAAFVLLLVAATGRSRLSGRPRWILVGSVSAGSGLLILEILRPGAVSGALNQGIQEIVPLAGLAGIGIAVYSVWQWWQARREEATTPDTQVVLGGNSD